jgi:hypothetical protein
MPSALRHRNFRLYVTAQVVSNIGTWIQITVENWLASTVAWSPIVTIAAAC